MPNKTLGIADLGVSNAMLANDDITFGDGITSEAINLGEAITITGSGNAAITYTAASNTFTISSTNATHTRGNGLTGGDYDGSATQTWAVDYGTSSNQAVEGNQTATITAGTGLTGGITTDALGDGFTTTLNVSETAIEGFIENDITDNYIPYDDGTKLVASNMYFDGNNIGIGTTSPNVALEVNGQIRTNVLRETSDARFKENIETIPNALEKTLSLRGVNYNWKVDFANKNRLDDNERLGLIAQEVEKIIPQAVSTDSDGYKSISYTSLVGLLIEAIKDQNNTIKDQNKTIENQDNQINVQSRRVNYLFELLDKNGFEIDKNKQDI